MWTARLQSLLSAISAWALPAKFLVSAALGAFAGAGVLGWVFEFATYSYALSYGFRPPVEGIPYLRAAVAGASFALLLTGAALAAVLIFGLQHGEVSKRFTARGHRAMAIIFATVALLGLVVIYALPPLARLMDMQSGTATITHAVSAVIGLAIGAALSAAAAWRPNLVWWLSSGAVVVYYLWVIIALFSPSVYGSLLRVTGFGGGIPVAVRVEQGPDRQPAILSGHLMIRTTWGVVLLAGQPERFVEIPLERVLDVGYSVGGLNALPYRMPGSAAAQ